MVADNKKICKNFFLLVKPFLYLKVKKVCWKVLAEAPKKIICKGL